MKRHNDIDANCPECGHKVDDATAPEDLEARPEEGSVGVCIQCAGVGIYFRREDGKLGLRLPTFDEKVELSENEDLSRLRMAVTAQSIWFTP